MQDVLLVRMLHPERHPDEQIEALIEREPQAPTVVADRLTRNVLHRQIGKAIGCRAGFEHLGDRRMTHPRQRLALDLEAHRRLRTRELVLHELERDLTLHRLQLVGEEHLTHAAGTEQPAQFERPETLADQHLDRSARVDAIGARQRYLVQARGRRRSGVVHRCRHRPTFH